MFDDGREAEVKHEWTLRQLLGTEHDRYKRSQKRRIYIPLILYGVVPLSSFVSIIIIIIWNLLLILDFSSIADHFPYTQLLFYNYTRTSSTPLN